MSAERKVIIDQDMAAKVVRDCAAGGQLNPAWRQMIDMFSKLAEKGPATHVAFFAAAVLAKAVDHRVDPRALRPSKENPRSYNARQLCQKVLAPLAVELEFSLGVSGSDPLANQPYFRMLRLGDGTPIHSSGRPTFDYMLTLVEQLEVMTDERPAREALRAFIAVRRHYKDGVLARAGKKSNEGAGAPEAHLFISYCKADGNDIAQALAAELEARTRRCWIAPRDQEPGLPYGGQITRAIREGRALVLLLTPGANDSRTVLQEVETAHKAGKRIVPVVVRGTQPSDDLNIYVAAIHQIDWGDAIRTAAAICKAFAPSGAVDA